MPIYFLSALEWMETVVLLAVDKFLFPLESWLAVKQAFFNHVNSGYSFSCPNVPISWCFVDILNKPNSLEFGFSLFFPRNELIQSKLGCTIQFATCKHCNSLS